MATAAVAGSTAPAPPAARKFPCSQCGARLDYDPKRSSLCCPYCGYAERIFDDALGVVERNLESYLADPPKGHPLPGHSTEVTCGGCGAIVILEDNVAADRCPFCTTHLENAPRAAGDMIVPESILPFAVDYHQAKKAFEDWIHARWFAPDGLHRMANLGQLQGMYLPFWIYDSKTYTKYSGQRGIERSAGMYDDDLMPGGNILGRMNGRSYVEWQEVHGDVHHRFDEMLVCASKSLPYDKVAQLQPWDVEQIVRFKPEYLSGFKAERYAIELPEGFAMSKVLMEPLIQGMCRNDIGGDYQILESWNTRHEDVKFKHALLPVWIASYRYYGKLYQILVNARTGEVVGDRPWSIFKIAALVALLLSLAAVVLYFTQ